MVNLSRKLFSSMCLCFVLSACAQPTVRDACENQWNLCLVGTDAASFLTEDEFISSVRMLPMAKMNRAQWRGRRDTMRSRCGHMRRNRTLC